MRCLLSLRYIFFFFSLFVTVSCESIDLDEEKVRPGEICKMMEIKGIPFHQSMAMWSDYALFQVIENDELYSYVYNIKSKSFLGKLQLPHFDYKSPHANCSCFGNLFYDDDSLLPLLYVSQWKWNGERGVLVYNIKKNFTVELIQFIAPLKIRKDIIGYGDIDWVVDTDSERLYALAYKKAGASTITEDNEEIITAFHLPTVKNNSTVILTEEDIIDSFRCEVFNYSQDKTYKGGKIYVISGGNDANLAFMNNMRIIDLKTKSVIYKKNIYNEGQAHAEPEGLSFCGDELFLTYAYHPNTLWKFNL